MKSLPWPGRSTPSSFPPAAADFTSKSGTLTFQPGGATTQFISVAVIDDNQAESGETFSVSLSGASGATLADATAVVTIADNDAAISIAGASVSEGNPPKGNKNSGGTRHLEIKHC